MAKDGNGRLKLEYLYCGKQRIVLWEQYGGIVLETAFGSNGSILMQKPMKQESGIIDYRMKQFLLEAGISEAMEKEFTEIKLDKRCPKCNGYGLSRYIEAFSKNEIPVMPLYYCKHCKAQSYHMTDEYLQYLIENNSGLFSEAELSEMSKDKGVFLAELRGYIIRIFASKKVMNIE